MNRKPLKILITGEASFISSGYGTYQHRLLSRLSENPNFNIAEFACYAGVNDPRDSVCNWRFYANAVGDTDPRITEYNQHPQNAFGRWRFDSVVAHFQPDVVIDIRDFWMNSYQRISSFRNSFHWILMPTVDSMPQKEDWLDAYMDCDAIFTYSDWARDVLLTQTSNQIKYIDTCSPGYDEEYLKLVSATEAINNRQKLGIPEDITIIGTVMRNQKRKLFAELIRDFRLLLENLKEEKNPKYHNTFLYLHTSFPDVQCWEIPKLLKEFRMLNKTLFTYLCKKCRNIQSSLYSGPKCKCGKCGQFSCILPTVSDGVTRSQLGQIYSVFDLYVQYSICEGFGMPQVEAASCGIPILTPEYSAMEDIIKKLKAYKIDIAYKFRELETFADRTYPDRMSFIKNVKDFLSLDVFKKHMLKINTYHRCFKYYKWSDTLDKWENYLTQLYQSDFRANYSFQEQVPLIEEKEIESFSCSLDIIKYLFSRLNNSGLNKYTAMDMLNRINYGFVLENGSQRSFDVNSAINNINYLIDKNNKSNNLLNRNYLDNLDYIQYANMKDPSI